MTHWHTSSNRVSHCRGEGGWWYTEDYRPVMDNNGGQNRLLYSLILVVDPFPSMFPPNTVIL